MNRRNFLRSAYITLTGGMACFFLSGCIAPLVSPTVSEQDTQAWRCENCGHLTRSDRDLSVTRCPRCKRIGFLRKITHKELLDYLKLYSAS